eukprot:363127-Chlamydomonas_euryale.AAC.5
MASRPAASGTFGGGGGRRGWHARPSSPAHMWEPPAPKDAAPHIVLQSVHASMHEACHTPPLSPKRESRLKIKHVSKHLASAALPPHARACPCMRMPCA